ncbi:MULTISPECIES: hypothetical protein [Rhizobium]|uniref:Uncharacterized protein n=3 Tax=Rhizobium TaxID=379 RepID=A0A0B4X6J3_9HYPH|nr:MULTISPECIES: hypothetical protein [Rhizobium]AJD43704.1 hypothetical protein RGR602_PB00166 [Rhizobium gallicum bv. gallicum R602sp]APO70190.1 hypothetical protein IE4872_PC00160 [Rhizobium gallicum]MBB4276531.1 hypothetical protein [Rhizobium mongolense]
MAGLGHDGPSAKVDIGPTGVHLRLYDFVWIGQLLGHSFKPPKRDPETDVYAFLVPEFVNALRQCLKDGGCAQRHNEAERGGTFLVGYARTGRLCRLRMREQNSWARSWYLHTARLAEG